MLKFLSVSYVAVLFCIIGGPVALLGNPKEKISFISGNLQEKGKCVGK